MSRRFWLSHLCFRVGLGIVFLWIGIDSIRHPDAWLGFIPSDVPFGLTRTLALHLGALFDITVGVLLIVNTLPKLTAFLAAIHLGFVLAISGIDAVLIRDVGLFGAALGLLVWPHGSHRRRWLPRWFRRRHATAEE